MRTFLVLFPIFLIACGPGFQAPTSVGLWDTFTVDLVGPECSEQDSVNPFLDYRMDLTITHSSGRQLLVPGYYAADGNAGETGADAGKVWRAHFTPGRVGEWSWQARLYSGEAIAVGLQDEGILVASSNGRMEVMAQDYETQDFRSHGRLVADNGYYRFEGSRSYWLKAGADSPENFLAFSDFDGTYRYQAQTREGESKTDSSLHRYEPHLQDWHEGDLSWQGGKGKGIIGAVNYLADQGMNSLYFLTLNIEGDGRDVWPYTDHRERLRFDCSKLDQWDKVFTHMERKGIMMHVVTQETENERLLDDGHVGIERTLYYRELIARFGHHLAITWNLGEENGPANFSPNGQTSEQRSTMAAFFEEHDPYGHPLVIHTHSTPPQKEELLPDLLGDPNLDGISMQINRSTDVYPEFIKWKARSLESGHSWLLAMDEIGPWWKGILPDSADPRHDTIRQEVLWGSLMAGAAGVEWYFGAHYPHNDLQCEDYRSRSEIWKQSRIAQKFFMDHIPFWEMEPMQLEKGAHGWVGLKKLGELYLLYGEPGKDNWPKLSLPPGTYQVRWFDPLNGEKLTIGTVEELRVPGQQNVGLPPTSHDQDWVILLRNKTDSDQR